MLSGFNPRLEFDDGGIRRDGIRSRITADLARGRLSGRSNLRVPDMPGVLHTEMIY